MIPSHVHGGQHLGRGRRLDGALGKETVRTATGDLAVRADAVRGCRESERLGGMSLWSTTIARLSFTSSPLDWMSAEMTWLPDGSLVMTELCQWEITNM
jgi:hypothetical protein